MVLHWAVLVSPGPNVIVVSQLAASGDRRAALLAGMGVTTVAGIWATLAALGVQAVFANHAGVRQAVQVVGGLYLLHLAVRLWQVGPQPPASLARRMGAAAAFNRGFVTNILNPKSVLFFSSVFATALPAAPSAQVLVTVVGLVLVNAGLWHALLAFAFSRPRVQAAYSRQRQRIGKTAGVLTGSFGLRLHWEVLRETFLVRLPTLP